MGTGAFRARGLDRFQGMRHVAEGNYLLVVVPSVVRGVAGSEFIVPQGEGSYCFVGFGSIL